MKKIFILAFVLLSTLISSHKTEALSIKMGSDVYIGDEKITENLYIAGGSVVLNGEYEKDVFVTGGQLKINGKISGDIIVIGGESEITGTVSGDVRVIGGNAKISGEVFGDLFIVTGRIDLLPTAKISGESIFVTAEINQSATLEKNSKILAGITYLNSTISGVADITTQKIVFEKDTNITGTLRYYAPVKAEEISGAQTPGQISFNEIKSIKDRGVVKSAILNLMSFWLIWKFLTTLILAFLAVYVFKVSSQGVTNLALDSIFRSFISGAFGMIWIPVVSAILFISLIALPIGVIFFIGFIFTMIIAPAFSGIIVGTLIYGLFDRENRNQITFAKSAIGVVLLTALQFVPILGNWTKAIFFLIAVGAIIRHTYQNVVR